MNAIEYKMMYDYGWSKNKTLLVDNKGLKYYDYELENTYPNFDAWIFEYPFESRILIMLPEYSVEKKITAISIFGDQITEAKKFVENEYLEFLSERNRKSIKSKTL